MTELKLNREIYTDKNIDIALDAYKDYKTVKKEPGDSYITIKILKSRYDSARTAKEFENYLIANENK